LVFEKIKDCLAHVRGVAGGGLGRRGGDQPFGGYNKIEKNKKNDFGEKWVLTLLVLTGAMGVTGRA
jgi:hypothetical protein